MALVRIEYKNSFAVFENPATYGANFLTGDDTDFEGGTVGSWAGTGVTPTNTTEQAQAGTHSLKATATSGAARNVFSAPMVVTAGTAYGAYGYLRSAVTSRFTRPWIIWYSDAAGTTVISITYGGGAYITTTTGWIRLQVGGTAPPTAIRARVVFEWANTAANEVQYVDSVYFSTVTAAVNTATTIKVECWARGGNGGNGNTTNKGGGGGGGAYARTNAFAVDVGASYSIQQGNATSFKDSFLSTLGVNAPTSTSTGVLAKGGNNGANASGVSDGAGGAGGTVAASFGVDAEFAGGAGATGAAGGGGAGDANAGAGQTGGSVGGGNGGAAGTNPGQIYGGGGGGGPILSGAGGAGGNGLVIITVDTGDDSVTASDNFTKVASFVRNIDETPTATDANSKSYSKPIADSATATDDNAKAYFKKNEDEVIVTSDNSTKSYSKPIAESVTASDDQTITLIAIRDFDETVSAVDAIAKSMSTPKADSVTASEDSFRHPKPNKSDSVTATDEVTLLSDWNRTITDSVTATDSISKSMSVRFADNISGSDPEPVIENPPFVLTTDGQLEKFVADISPYPLYTKL